MTSNTARAFICRFLSETQFKQLHNKEDILGYCVPPYWIHKRFNTPKNGPVDEMIEKTVSKICSGIHSDSLRYLIEEGHDYNGNLEVMVQHRTDIELRKRKIDYDGQKAETLKDKVRNGSMGVANESKFPNFGI